MRLVNDEQVALVFSHNALPSVEMNWIPAGGKKSLPVPAIEILLCTGPHGTVGIGKHDLDVAVENPLLVAV